jgi:hypothetical protein
MLYPNLALGPTKPALGNGRLQRLARRALIVLGTATTSQVMEWTCCRKRLHGRRTECHDYRAARRVLDRMAIRVGRARTRGRPWLWRLGTSDLEWTGLVPRSCRSSRSSALS